MSRRVKNRLQTCFNYGTQNEESDAVEERGGTGGPGEQSCEEGGEANELRHPRPPRAISFEMLLPLRKTVSPSLVHNEQKLLKDSF